MDNKDKVLIVEDQFITALDLKKQLEEQYDVIGITGNGNDALELTRKSRPDVILMDIMINGNINGVQTAHLIRNEYDVPVIFLTALIDDETYLEAKAVSPYGYLTKPFNHNDLLNVISHSLMLFRDGHVEKRRIS